VIRVPLIIAAPGIQPGRSRSLAQLVDVFPTLCELTGAPIPEGVEGKSLAPVLRDPAATVHEAVFSYDGQHHSLRSDRWAFMRYSDGTEELYDMKSDPGQHTNLAGHSGQTATLEGMRAQLQAHLQKHKPEGKGKKKGKK
jgi:iduronate 2-sulfatase